MTKDTMTLAVCDLVHAPWNPRTEADMDANNPEIVKLSNSIKSNGLLQPVGVWIGEDGVKVVIYGNRRLEAAKVAGLKDIDAVVYRGIDEGTAKILTREENENRFGVNPLLDARLLKDAVARGMNQADIAAACGVSEATICRRMKLTALDDEIAENIRPENCDTRALELLASYPAQVQKSAAKDILSRASYSRIKARDVSYVMAKLTHEINKDSWVFNGDRGEDRFSRCMACGMCTGAQPDLFADADEEGKPRCLDSSCYRRFENEAKAEIISAATVDADGVVVVKNACEEPYYSLNGRRSKKNNTAWVLFNQWTGVAHVKWGREKAFYDAEKKRAEEERRINNKKEEAENEANLERLESAWEKINEFISDVDAAIDIATESDIVFEDAEKIVSAFNLKFSRYPNAFGIVKLMLWRFKLSLDGIPSDCEGDVDKFLSGSPDESLHAAMRLFAVELFVSVRRGKSYFARGNADVRYTFASLFADEIGLTVAELSSLERDCH